MDFTLSEEHLELQKWAHEFAAKEIRPVASQYDATEEFPWPVLKRAAAAGLYSIDLYLQARQDPTGLTLPIAMEETFWGCCRRPYSFAQPARRVRSSLPPNSRRGSSQRRRQPPPVGQPTRRQHPARRRRATRRSRMILSGPKSWTRPRKRAS